MALHRRLVRVALMGLVVAGTFGCELMTAVDRDKIPEETPGAGGSAGAGGSKDGGVGGSNVGGSAGQGGQAGGGGTAGAGGEAGKGGAGGTAGAGGSTPECTVPADCDPPANECVEATCNGGKCGTSNKAAGTALATQVAGDCKKAQCNGQGVDESVNDDADLPVDANPCTKDVCTAGVPSNPPEAADTACGTGLKCNATGQCIGCNDATECPGADGECSKRSCSAEKICSLALVPAGTPTAAQTPGDCLENQCDAKGDIVSVPAQNDAVSDDNDCTQDVCLNGQSTHPNKSAGAECSSNGGIVCSGQGACVACTLASHCTGDPLPACQERTCTNNACGVGNKAAGTALASQVAGDCKEKQCDGSGAETEVNLDTDVPNDNQECTVDSCSAGAKVHTPKAEGTACGAGGALKCNAMGACVGCLTDGDCTDNNQCTTGDKCNAGTCEPGTGTLNCDDNNPCTDDACDAATGCSHTNNTAACDDGNACTTGDVCAAGSCTPGTTPLNCNDDNVCTDDSCVPATGCAHANNTAACTDGNACTTGDVCAAGVCTAGTTPLVCNDGNICTNDSCDPTQGCVTTNNTDPCNDNNACTTNDACSAGSCVGGAAPNCNDNNPCTDDTCVQATGCVNTNNTATCNDANECTNNDVCAAGTCAGTITSGASCGTNGVCNAEGVCVGCVNASDCVDSNPNDCLVPTCNAGVCGTTNAADNAVCSTGDPCKINERCAAGVCSISSPKCTVPAGPDQVCLDATCSPAGVCGTTPKQASIGCNADNSQCTENDACVAGVCTAGTAKVCTASDVCHVGTCNPTDGACGQAAANEGGACTFGDQCFSGKTCQAGNCTGGTAITCNDNKACTDDTCVPATGCLYTPDPTNTCTDSDACTTGDSCNAQGDCVPGTPVTCTALDQCHDVGTCNPGTGTCSNPNKADGSTCNDALYCTLTDACQGGTCTGTGSPTCTPPTDQCLDAASGVCNEATNSCDFSPAANGTACTSFTHKPAECTNATTLRTYTNAADCQTGVCTEKYTDTVCASGCAAGACTPTLLITEYVEGTSTNKAIELTNFGPGTFDLSQCQIRLYSNGATTASTTLTLAGTLSQGDSYVICNALAMSPECDLAHAGITGFNGDDALDLVCGGVVRDSFGRVGEDPGTNWGAGDTATVDRTLRRKCTVTSGDTINNDAFDPATEWDGFAVDTFDGFGAHCGYTKTITIDGTNDFDATLETIPAANTFTGYVSWDATNLYLGFQGTDIGAGDARDWLIIYLSGTPGSTTGQSYDSQQPTLPFNAQYHLRYRMSDGYSSMQSGAAWADDAGWTSAGNVVRNGNFIELQVPRATIGSPSKVSVHMSMLQEDSSEWTWAAFPSTSFTAGLDPNYTKYYEFFLKGPLAPAKYTPKP